MRSIFYSLIAVSLVCLFSSKVFSEEIGTVVSEEVKQPPKVVQPIAEFTEQELANQTAEAKLAEAQAKFPYVCQFSQSLFVNYYCKNKYKRELNKEYPLSTEEELKEKAHAFAKMFGDKYHKDVVCPSTPTADPNYDGRRLRGTHSKTIGCTRTTFTVLDNIPSDLKVGIFKDGGKEFKSWCRFANGTSFTQNDGKPDARAMSCKVIGATQGNKLFGAKDGNAIDFLMNNVPRFIAKSPDDFLEVAKGAMTGEAALIKDLAMGLKKDQFDALLSIKARNPKSLLDENYYSGSAYNWSTEEGKIVAVKYGMRKVPCDGDNVAPPKLPNHSTGDADAFRVEMAAHLSKHPACFQFGVQKQVDPWDQPVEDTTIEWQENGPGEKNPKKTTFVPLAKVVIPPQNIDNDAQREFCDEMSFSNWRTTDSMRPLGDLNKMRKYEYYESLAARQAERNHCGGHPEVKKPNDPEHPTGLEEFVNPVTVGTEGVKL